MKSIGKYEVLDEIGSSVTGTTYRARDNFQKREIALKVLHPLVKADVAAQDQYCREMLLYSELTHRHLVKVVDLGEIEGRIYIASKLLQGDDLARYADRNRELPLASKLAILAQACEGLAFAHSRGITHGAIKPSNIFVDASGDITILDFCVAKWQSLMLAAGSRPDGILPNYFAPEQILGQRCDSKSDLFSLALVSYEFLSGRYPFQVPASLIAREIVHSEPEPLRKVNPELPEGLEQLLIRALKKKPEERLETAEEFAASLYGIAQQLRRPAPAPVAAEPVATPIPVASTPPTPASPAPPASVEAEQNSKTPKREDVKAGNQDAPPWTARSYASTVGSFAENRPSASPPPAPASKIANSSWEEPYRDANAISPQASAPPAPTPQEAPLQTVAPRPTPSAIPQASASPQPPPRSMPIPAPLAAPPATRPPNRAARRRPAPNPLNRRIIVIAAGAVLAIYLVLSFISHQGLHATQTVRPKAAAPQHHAIAVPSTESVVTPVETATPAEVQPAAAARASEAPKSGPGPEQILRKQVKPLWEAGKYAEAMTLVDDVLVKSPANAEARAWKKRIRAAQEAEAAIK